jgi:hypothetical protein
VGVSARQVGIFGVGEKSAKFWEADSSSLNGLKPSASGNTISVFILSQDNFASGLPSTVGWWLHPKEGYKTIFHLS